MNRIDILAKTLREKALPPPENIIGEWEKPPGELGESGTWDGEISWGRRLNNGVVLLYFVNMLIGIDKIPAPEIGPHKYFADVYSAPRRPEDIFSAILRIYDEEKKRFIWGQVTSGHHTTPIFKSDMTLWEKETLSNINNKLPGTSIQAKIFDSKDIKENAQKSLDFADALYGVLTNNVFFNTDTNKIESLSFRGAARLVAAIRNAGESYLDFYGVGNEGTRNQDIEKMLENIGLTKDFPKEEEVVSLRMT